MIRQDVLKTVPGLFSSVLMPELSEAARAGIIGNWVDPGLVERTLGPFVKASPDDLRRLGILHIAPKDFRP